jgi:hypothetical protein
MELMQVSSFDFLGTAVARIERLMEEAVVMAADKGRLLFECLLRLTFFVA